MKRIFGLFLCVCMLLGMMPFAGVSAASPEADFTFDPMTGTVIKYTGPGGVVEIPASIGGTAVTAISNQAFLKCSSLTSIIIPAGVTVIGDQAFLGCTGLTEITILGVTVIGVQAFLGCTGLTDITIPAGVTVIGVQAFINCTGLTSITFHSRTTVINDSGNTIPAAAIIMGHDPSTAKEYAVKYSRTFKLIASPESDFEFDAATGTVTRYTGPGGVVEIPASIGGTAVTALGNEAFFDCIGLTDITIPAGVTVIGDGAFLGCTGLTDITFHCQTTVINDSENTIPAAAIIMGHDPSTAKEYAVKYSRTFELIASPESDFEFDAATGTITGYTGPGGIVEIPASIGGTAVTAIGDFAFYTCHTLTDITIPDSVTVIGDYAFGACPSLTGITIPDSVTAIGKYAFIDCVSLTGITIPAGVTVIGDSAFADCPLFTTIYGVSGSYAQTYAIANGYTFIAPISTPDITAPPVASAITYGQTLADSILTGGEASVDGSFAWTDGTVAPAVSDSGTTLYSVTFTPADIINYESVTTDITVTVQKAVPVVLLEDKYAVYTRQAVPIGDAEVTLVNGETFCGPVTYTYYTDYACTRPTRRIHGAATSGSAPRNIGVYYVKAAVGETGNYTAAESNTAILSVSLFRPVAYYTVISSGSPGGFISPSETAVPGHTAKVFIIVPQKGYEIADILVDGVSAGNVRYYVFYNITSHHTISAEFKPIK